MKIEKRKADRKEAFARRVRDRGVRRKLMSVLERDDDGDGSIRPAVIARDLVGVCHRSLSFTKV